MPDYVRAFGRQEVNWSYDIGKSVIEIFVSLDQVLFTVFAI